MSFENSPKLGNPSKPIYTFSGWMHKLRPLLISVAVLLVIFDVLFLVYQVEPDHLFLSTGGLDGCLATSGGAPFVATVWVDKLSVPTYEDGCFFFADLQQGEHQFQVQAAAGIIYTQSVAIVSDQALALGTIQIGP